MGSDPFILIQLVILSNAIIEVPPGLKSAMESISLVAHVLTEVLSNFLEVSCRRLRTV